MYYQIGNKIIGSDQPLVGSNKSETILRQLQGHAKGKDLEIQLAVKQAAQNIYEGFNKKLGIFCRVWHQIKSLVGQGNEYIQKVDTLFKEIMAGVEPAVASLEDQNVANLRSAVTHLQAQLDQKKAELDQKNAKIQQLEQETKATKEINERLTTSAPDTF